MAYDKSRLSRDVITGVTLAAVVMGTTVSSCRPSTNREGTLAVTVRAVSRKTLDASLSYGHGSLDPRRPCCRWAAS
jgi:hypothetical protein